MKKLLLGIALSFTALCMAANTPVTPAGLLIHHIGSTSPLPENGSGPVVKAYLEVKDALAADNSKAAAEGGRQLTTALKALGRQAVSSAEKQVFNKDGQAAIKAAALISGTQDIQAQRNAFKALSEQLYQLVKSNGSTQALYLDYCPMAKATWLSQQKSISNPYYGKAMATCGTVRETIEPQK